MPLLALLAGLALLGGTGCGARSALVEGTTTTTVVTPGDCPAALLAGAPAPMRGYCSTRSHRTSGRLPGAAGTAFTWQTPLAMPVAYEALEIVVDDQGRSYATVDTDLDSDAVTPDTILAFDADGTLAWTQSFSEMAPSSLFLAPDGTLHLRVDGAPPELVVLSRDGAQISTSPLPAKQIPDFAVGRDGSLYTTILDSEESESIAKLTPSGALVWQSPVLPLCSLGTSPIVLGKDDQVIVMFAATADSCQTSTVPRLVALDPEGQVAWAHDFTGAADWAIDPGLAPDGTIRVGLAQSDTSQPITLAALSASGESLWETTLPGSPINVWESAMPIGADGTAYPRTNSGVAAVSASGQVLWQRVASPSFAYDAVVDEHGTLAVSDGPTMGFDTATGDQRWGVEVGVAPPFAAGAEGSLVGMRALGQEQFAFVSVAGP